MLGLPKTPCKQSSGQHQRLWDISLFRILRAVRFRALKGGRQGRKTLPHCLGIGTLWVVCSVTCRRQGQWTYPSRLTSRLHRDPHRAAGFLPTRF